MLENDPKYSTVIGLSITSCLFVICLRLDLISN